MGLRVTHLANHIYDLTDERGHVGTLVLWPDTAARWLPLFTGASELLAVIKDRIEQRPGAATEAILDAIDACEPPVPDTELLRGAGE